MPLVILPWWALLTPGFMIFICILWMMLTLLFFPGNRSAGQANTKGVPKTLIVPIILAAGLVTGVVASAALLYVGCLMCMDDGGNKRAKAAEWNAVQSAIDTSMAETVLTEITPSASGVGGEKINGTGTQFHAPLELNLYLRDLPSTYCYRWRSSGLIIAQYSVNSEGNCVIDAD